MYILWLQISQKCNQNATAHYFLCKSTQPVAQTLTKKTLSRSRRFQKQSPQCLQQSPHVHVHGVEDLDLSSKFGILVCRRSGSFVSTLRGSDGIGSRSTIPAASITNATSASAADSAGACKPFTSNQTIMTCAQRVTPATCSRSAKCSINIYYYFFDRISEEEQEKAK